MCVPVAIRGSLCASVCSIALSKGAIEHMVDRVSEAIFQIHPDRSKTAFVQLIGDWTGILVSDGYRVYQSWEGLRQSCLAHLIRTAKGLAEGVEAGMARFGGQMHAELQHAHTHLHEALATSSLSHRVYPSPPRVPEGGHRPMTTIPDFAPQGNKPTPAVRRVACQAACRVHAPLAGRGG